MHNSGARSPANSLNVTQPFMQKHLTDDAQDSESSEQFRTLRKTSETFGTIPNSSETFRTIRNNAERKESHTLTVREAARMFENAGVARTERSIINWCQPNKLGVPRLDAYFDPNERKYFITEQSVLLAIKEEQAKADNRATSENVEPSAGVRKDSEDRSVKRRPDGAEEITVLQQELMDLKITNRGKDYFIGQLQKEREAFTVERKEYVEQLMSFNRQVGELETKLRQLGAPKVDDFHPQNDNSTS